jgi:SIR2-like domain
VSAESTDLSEHYKTVVRGLTLGRVTLVLGAGANLIGRPPETRWVPGGEYLPSGGELAEYLAGVFNYDGDPNDLVRVSQYVAVIRGGTGPLYDELHQVFDHDYAPTQLHEFLAALPATLQAKDQLLRGPPLILTTNYDDLLEQAFEAAGVPYDVVIYVADGKDAGKFRHQPPGKGEKAQLIKEPETYIQLDPTQRTVILKIHGFVDRGHPDPEDASDSYVITEDHYIEYLSRTDLDNLVPVKLLRRLRKCHFLFLGYSMRDWNLRAILHQIWADREQEYDSWSVQIHADPLETKSWERREVQIFDMPLTHYLGGLHDYLSTDVPETGVRQ